MTSTRTKTLFRQFRIWLRSFLCWSYRHSTVPITSLFIWMTKASTSQSSPCCFPKIQNTSRDCKTWPTSINFIKSSIKHRSATPKEHNNSCGCSRSFENYRGIRNSKAPSKMSIRLSLNCSTTNWHSTISSRCVLSSIVLAHSFPQSLWEKVESAKLH